MSEEKFVEIATRAEDLKNEIGDSIDKISKYGNIEEKNYNEDEIYKTVEEKIESLKDDVKNLKELRKQQKKLQKLELKKDSVLKEIDKEKGHHHGKKDRRRK